MAPRTRRETTASCRFENLPYAVVVEILAWLSAESLLLSARFVCKAWHRCITTDPYFHDLHRSRAIAIHKRHPVYVILTVFPEAQDRLLLLDGTGGGGGRGGASSCCYLSSINGGPEAMVLPFAPHTFVTSTCCGLSCCLFLGTTSQLVFVRNLVTGEQVTVSPKTFFPRTRSMLFEIGFDPKEGVYKLLHLIPIPSAVGFIGSGHNTFEAQVYTLGSEEEEEECWRSIPSGCPFPLLTHHGTPIYCCGTLNWLMRCDDYGINDDNDGMGGDGVPVISFDVGMETFRVIMGPKLSPEREARNLFSWCDEKLSLVVEDRGRRALEIWMLKDVLNNSWSNLHTIHEEILGHWFDRCPCVVGSWVDGDQLLIQTFGALLAFSPTHKNLRLLRLPFHNNITWFSFMHMHMGCLTPLRRLLQRGNKQRKLQAEDL